MYPVKFSRDTKPNIFDAFLNVIHWIKGHYDLDGINNAGQIIDLLRTDFDICLTDERNPDTIVYTAEFPNEQQFVWFMLRWS